MKMYVLVGTGAVALNTLPRGTIPGCPLPIIFYSQAWHSVRGTSSPFWRHPPILASQADIPYIPHDRYTDRHTYWQNTGWQTKRLHEIFKNNISKGDINNNITFHCDSNTACFSLLCQFMAIFQPIPAEMSFSVPSMLTPQPCRQEPR
jgi:hypothetical protein